ncbi:MAG: glycosyltransferase family 2 protein [Bacteroidetes bacterium]|nr:glycosyltransferase family 2 protein [Bacteroidota bacterium]
MQPYYDIELVQPMYNPPFNWVSTYIKQHQELQQLFGDKKIKTRLINDGSTQNVDETHIKQLQETIKDIEFISYPKNKGKGFALRTGVKHAEGAHVLYTDYDFPYDMEGLKKAYEQLLQGYDIVIGIRGADYYQRLSFFRTIISKGFNFFTTRILKIPYPDTQSGLKAFSVEGKKQLLQTRIHRFLFDTELIYHAHRTKETRITTIPLSLSKHACFTKISVKVLLQELNNLVSLLR